MQRMKKGGIAGNEPDLQAAARTGDLKTVQSILISNPLAVNSRDKHSRTPLHLAAWAGQTEVVNYLCKHKADTGAAAMDDMGAIHFAAQKGHLQVVQTLLTSGVSVKASTRKGLTPLHYAVQGSYLDLVKYLVKKGASLTVTTKAGKTPIDLASNEEIRLFLIEWERSSKNGTKGVDKDEESHPKTSVQDASANDDGELNRVGPHDQSEDETVKRRSEEDVVSEGSEPKRPRVALNHLLSADDTQEDESW